MGDIMYNKKEREYYNQHRQSVCESLGITKNKYNWFRREGNKLHKLYEDNCNGLFIDEEDFIEQAETIEEKIQLKLLDMPTIKDVFFQTDPRGATIYLDTKEIPENNYTSAKCIY
jgi:hypothetical protein